MRKFVLILSFVALISVISAKRRPLLCGCKPGYPAVCDTNGKRWNNLCELNCANHEPVEHDPEGNCLKKANKGEDLGQFVPFESIKKSTFWILLLITVIAPKPARHPVLCGCPPSDSPVCDTNGKRWRSLCELKCANHEPVEHDPQGTCWKEVYTDYAMWLTLIYVKI